MEHFQGSQFLRLVVRAVENGHDLGRHHDNVGHFLFFDVGDDRLRIEFFVEDVGGAQKHPRHQVQHGAVEDDCSGVQAHAFGCHTPGGGEDGAIHGPHVMGMHDALGRAGSAAGVHDIVHVMVVDGDFGQVPIAGGCHEILVAAKAVPVLVQSHQHVAVFGDGGQIAAQPVQHVGEVLVGDHQGGVGVFQQGGKAALVEHSAAGHDDQTGFGRGPVCRHELGAVGQDRGELVAFGEPAGQKGIGQLVHVSVKRSVGEALFSADEGRMIRTIARVVGQEAADVHKAFPLNNLRVHSS